MITERDRIIFYIDTIFETAYRSECSGAEPDVVNIRGLAQI